MKAQNSMEEINFTPDKDLTELKNSVENVKIEIGKIIVGQENIIDILISAILADGHVLIEGVPGKHC